MSIARLIGWMVTIAVIGATGLVLYAAAQLYVPEDRPPRTMMLTNAPYITRVATLPRTPEFSGYDTNGEPVQLDLGYSYREMSALWMPFLAWEDQGLVLYAANADRISIAPVTDIDRAAMIKATGTDPAAGYSFPTYAHVWGWLLVVAAALATWLLVKRAEWRRDKAGIM